MKKLAELLAFNAICILAACAEDERNLNLVLMHSTCKIVGESTSAGKSEIGTGFILLKPVVGRSNAWFTMLTTANHVFSKTKGEFVTMTFRRAKNTNEWERADFKLPIRSGNKTLWSKHPEVDLAAIWVRGLPTNVIHMKWLATTELLMTDDEIREWEITTGYELLCLGYPLGFEANPQGFPILRSGRIASYPLLPTRETKAFLFDFTVFPGNSGGPVYFYQNNPYYAARHHAGRSIRGIMGLVIEEERFSEYREQLHERRLSITPLGIGRVIHASFIRDLLESMPEPHR